MNRAEMMRKSNFVHQVINALAWMKERGDFTNWMETIRDFTVDTCEGQDPFINNPWKSWMIQDIQEMEEDYRGFIDDYNEFFDMFNAWKSGTVNESILRLIIRKALIKEHLHGYKGKEFAKYMDRELPPEASQLPHFNEYKEEFDRIKQDINQNYRQLTNLSIEYPKMYKLQPVDLDAMDYLDFNEMNAAEKYEYIKTELMYQKEDLIQLWRDLDEELGITDGFAGY